jgi:ribokinase
MGLSDVLLTLGEHGVWHLSGQTIRHTPAHDVDVVDTTGAGDAFTGGFAASLAKGASCGRAIETGVIAAGFAITRKGVQDAMPTMDELERFKAKTT